MATDAYTNFHTNASTGANINAGSTEGAAAYTATNGGWNSGTGVFTPASGDPSASVAVGDFASVYVDGATTAVFIGRVTAVSSTTVTVSTTAKSGTAPTTNATARSITVGGVWLGPNAAADFPFDFVDNTMTNSSGHYPRVNLKNNATYSVTAAIVHNNSSGSLVTFQGYTTTPGDGGKALIQGPSTGAAFAVLTYSSSCTLRDLIFHRNGATSTAHGVRANTTGCIIERCVFFGMRGNGFVSLVGYAQIIECEAYENNASNTADGGGFSSPGVGDLYTNCRSHDNAGSNTSGWVSTAATVRMDLTNCIADTNGEDGVKVTSGATTAIVTLRNCDLYGNTGNGIDMACTGGNPRLLALNSIFDSNGAYGIGDSGAGVVMGVMRNCAFRNNTSGTVEPTHMDTSGTITLSAIPYRDAPNGDFTLISAEVIATGRSQFPTNAGGGYTAITGYPDVGSVDYDKVSGGLVAGQGPLVGRGRLVGC